MHKIIKDLLDKHRYDDLPKDRAVFWSFGGTIADGESRSQASVNEHLALCYAQMENARMGFYDYSNYTPQKNHPDHFRTMDMEILGRYVSNRKPPFDYVGAKDLPYHEEVMFWGELSRRFADKASGTIAVAVDGTIPRTNFMRVEYLAIMDNPLIQHVRPIVGKRRETGKRVGVRKEDGARVELDIRSEADWYRRESPYFPVGNYNVIPNEDLKALPKNDWADQQKQQWFEAITGTLKYYLSKADPKRSEALPGHANTHLYEGRRDRFYRATGDFVSYIDFTLKEVDRLSKAAEMQEYGAITSLIDERKRLQRCRDIVDAYPELLHFREPVSELEDKIVSMYYSPEKKAEWDKQHKWPLEDRPATVEDRIQKTTQYLGDYFLKCDTTKNTEEKTALWGALHDYDHNTQKFVANRNPPPASEYERVKAMESYTEQKISQIKERLFELTKPGRGHEGAKAQAR